MSKRSNVDLCLAVASRKPHVGDILNYRYLFLSESNQGQVEGGKPRPALVVAILEDKKLKTSLRVFLAPITHTPPGNPSQGYLLPEANSLTAGLDQEESYVLYTELNSFIWRGYDVEKILFSNPPTEYFGQLDLETTNEVRRLLGTCSNIVQR